MCARAGGANDSRAHSGGIAPRLCTIEGGPRSHLSTRSSNSTADLPATAAQLRRMAMHDQRNRHDGCGEGQEGAEGEHYVGETDYREQHK